MCTSIFMFNEYAKNFLSTFGLLAIDSPVHFAHFFLQKNSAVVNEWVSQVRELERRILFCSRRTNVAQYRLL